MEFFYLPNFFSEIGRNAYELLAEKKHARSSKTEKKTWFLRRHWRWFNFATTSCDSGIFLLHYMVTYRKKKFVVEIDNRKSIRTKNSSTKHKKKLSDIDRQKKDCFLSEVKKKVCKQQKLWPPSPPPQISNGASLILASLLNCHFRHNFSLGHMWSHHHKWAEIQGGWLLTREFPPKLLL